MPKFRPVAFAMLLACSGANTSAIDAPAPAPASVPDEIVEQSVGSPCRDSDGCNGDEICSVIAINGENVATSCIPRDNPCSALKCGTGRVCNGRLILVDPTHLGCRDAPDGGR